MAEKTAAKKSTDKKAAEPKTKKADPAAKADAPATKKAPPKKKKAPAESAEDAMKRKFRDALAHKQGTRGADRFPTPKDLFDITKFGGWDKVNTDFFDPEKGIVAKIFQDQGKSTESG
jgi:hypothetical protein